MNKDVIAYWQLHDTAVLKVNIQLRYERINITGWIQCTHGKNLIYFINYLAIHNKIKDSKDL